MSTSNGPALHTGRCGRTANATRKFSRQARTEERLDAEPVKWQSSFMQHNIHFGHKHDDGTASPGRPLIWRTGRFRLVLDRVHVMGVVNVTPDSFSDGGRYVDADAAIEHARRLVSQGADLLDLGAESTRPHATPVSAEQEWRRLQPVLTEVLKLGVPVSVDTQKTEVMYAALEAGADIINDVRALMAPGALGALAAYPKAGVCLMHSRGSPATMQTLALYDDVVVRVADFLNARFDIALEAGIAAERIVLDPGYGFAKVAAHGVELLARQSDLLARLARAGMGRPLLVGLSRKSILGQLTGRPVQERLAGSLAAALLAAQQGARVLRVHDVAETVDVLKVWQAVAGAQRSLAQAPGALPQPGDKVRPADPGEAVAIGLGANLGPARTTLQWALRQLYTHPAVQLHSVSSLYRSLPVDAEGPDYLNAVALLSTTLSPEALLDLLAATELDAGRERPYHHAPRTLDLDLLVFGQRVLDGARLTLPHPRLHKRRFVLEPLAQVAADLQIPGVGYAASALLKVADQKVERIDDPDWWRDDLDRNVPPTPVGR